MNVGTIIPSASSFRANGVSDQHVEVEPVVKEVMKNIVSIQNNEINKAALFLKSKSFIQVLSETYQAGRGRFIIMGVLVIPMVILFLFVLHKTHQENALFDYVYTSSIPPGYIFRLMNQDNKLCLYKDSIKAFYERGQEPMDQLSPIGLFTGSQEATKRYSKYMKEVTKQRLLTSNMRSSLEENLKALAKIAKEKCLPPEYFSYVIMIHLSHSIKSYQDTQKENLKYFLVSQEQMIKKYINAYQAEDEFINHINSIVSNIEPFFDEIAMCTKSDIKNVGDFLQHIEEILISKIETLKTLNYFKQLTSNSFSDAKSQEQVIMQELRKQIAKAKSTCLLAVHKKIILFLALKSNEIYAWNNVMHKKCKERANKISNHLIHIKNPILNLHIRSKPFYALSPEYEEEFEPEDIVNWNVYSKCVEENVTHLKKNVFECYPSEMHPSLDDSIERMRKDVEKSSSSLLWINAIQETCSVYWCQRMWGFVIQDDYTNQVTDYKEILHAIEYYHQRSVGLLLCSLLSTGDRPSLGLYQMIKVIGYKEWSIITAELSLICDKKEEDIRSMFDTILNHESDVQDAKDSDEFKEVEQLCRNYVEKYNEVIQQGLRIIDLIYLNDDGHDCRPSILNTISLSPEQEAKCVKSARAVLLTRGRELTRNS